MDPLQKIFLNGPFIETHKDKRFIQFIIYKNNYNLHNFRELALKAHYGPQHFDT